MVENSCNIVTLPQVAFGSAPLVSGFTSITPNMTIRCTKTAPYSISLSNGNSGGSPREMWLAGDSSKKLKYELYKPGSSADRWGDAGTARFENLIGSGLNQDYSFRAEILPGQPTPPSGTYTDNIQLTVTY
ncbi:Spore Coat Protein U domain protein [compost metagenome]